MRLRSKWAISLMVIIVAGLILSSSVPRTFAAEPSLEDVLINLGFVNTSEAAIETFPAGLYQVTLYAEFAGYHDSNELSFYPVSTSSYSLLFSGPEGNNGYVVPPINKTFSSNITFGISMYVGSEDHRYFTENWRNPDGQNHSKVYLNLDIPNMYLIGFENLYGLGDRDFNDMVFSLQMSTSILNITATPGGSTSPITGIYTHSTLTNVTVTAVPDTHYVFDQWELDGISVGSGNPYTVFLTEPYQELHAVFTPQNYNLTILASTGGTTTPTSGMYTYVAGTNVSVMALPDTNYSFDHWILDGLDAGSSNPIFVLMYDDHVLEPVFMYIQPTYYLTVATDPDGVTTIPGEGWYNESENAFLTAPELVNGTSGIRYIFVRWYIDGSPQTLGTNPITVYMDANHIATAHYKTQYYMTVTSPYGSPTPLSGWFDDGTVITSSVTSPQAGPPNTRYVCIGWTGTGSVPASGSSTEVTFTILEVSSVIWNWKTQYFLQVETDPLGLVTIPGEGWHDAGSNVDLSAPSLIGYNFLNWTIDGVSQGQGVSSIPVDMDEPHDAVAHYKEKIEVGGIIRPIKQDFLSAWISFNGLLIAAVVGAVTWIKKRRD